MRIMEMYDTGRFHVIVNVNVRVERRQLYYIKETRKEKGMAWAVNELRKIIPNVPLLKAKEFVDSL